MARRITSWLSLGSIGLLMLLPVWIITTTYYRLPFGDTWDAIIPMYFNSLKHTISWSQLLAHHNEHRLFFTRVIYLAVYHGFHGNHAIIVGTSYALFVGLYALFIIQLKTQRSNGSALLIALILFVSSNYDIWHWAFVIQFPLTVFFVCSCIFCLSTTPLSWSRWTASIALAWGATLSSASGLAIWPIGVTLLLLYRQAKIKTVLFVIIGIVTIVWYQHGSPGQSLDISQPVKSLLYFINFLGNPVAFHMGNVIAPIIGAIALTLYIRLALHSWKNKVRAEVFALLPWLALGLFSLINACVGAFTRVQFGTNQALSSRYVCISTLLYIALLAGYRILWPELKPRLQRLLIANLILLIALLIMQNITVVRLLLTRYYYNPQAIALPYGVILPKAHDLYPPGNHFIANKLALYRASALYQNQSPQPNYLGHVLSATAMQHMGKALSKSNFAITPTTNKLTGITAMTGLAIQGEISTITPPSTPSRTLLLLNQTQRVVGVAILKNARHGRLPLAGFVLNHQHVDQILWLNKNYAPKQTTHPNI